MSQWVFRWRGYVFVPTALMVLYYCHPTTESFVLGLMVALAGELLRCWGVGYSGVTTRDSQVIAPRLVTAGPYAHVRNPLYLGNFITAVGFGIVAAGGLCWPMRSILFGTLCLTYGVVYARIIIPLEEAYLEKTFGEPYRRYLQQVPRLVPQVAPYAGAEGTFDPAVIVRAEIHTLALFTVMVLAMASRLPHPLDAVLTLARWLAW